MYLQVSSAGVHMASEVQGLVVLPHEVAENAATLTCAPAALITLSSLQIDRC